MPKPQTPSIRMVAERGGVCIATVSNVLNDKASVSPDFAERVLKAVGELGYFVDISASRLCSGKAALVGVVVPDLTNPMFASFVSTLEHATCLDGCDLVVVSARNDPAEEADRLSNLRSWRPAGLIVISCDGAFAARLPAGHAVPVVVADRIPDADGFDLVAVDNGPASAAIGRHLGAIGCRTCFVVGTSLSISNVRERCEGILSASGPIAFEMLEVGLETGDEVAAPSARLSGAARPDAFSALDHTTSLALYRLVGALGLGIPEDIAYASFDEMEWMRLVSPALTAVRQPVEAMAESAWALLSRRMAGAGDEPVTQRLRCAVEFRGSTSREGASPRSAAA